MKNIRFIKLPKAHSFNVDLPINLDIPLPVFLENEKDFASDNLSLKAENILLGLLKVITYDKKNPHREYYKSLLFKAKKDIKTELTSTAILKAKNEDWDEAEELFLTVLALDEKDTNATLNLALFYDTKGSALTKNGHEDMGAKTDEIAFSYYSKAVSSDDASADVFFNYAFYNLKLHNYKEAKSNLETYLALTCDIADDKLGEDGIYKKERADEILTHINNEGLDDERFLQAYNCINEDKLEKGLKAARSFIESHPYSAKAWFLLGWGLRKQSRFNDALKAFTKSQELDKNENVELLNEIALCKIETGNLTSARIDLESALKIDGENVKIISNLGFLALREGKKAKAKKYFQSALAYSPNDIIAKNELKKLEESEQ